MTNERRGWIIQALRIHVEGLPSGSFRSDALALVDELTSLADVTRERDAYIELEGRLCPEDVGFEEFIGVLRKKLTSPPAPSGWQQRIAALSPWSFDYGSKVRRCYFCGVPEIEQRGGQHAATCLWQNAKDALPPAPEATPASSEFDDLLGRLVMVARRHRRVDSTEVLMSTLSVLDGVREAIRQSWKCGGCGHGFATVGHMLHVSNERAAATEADASPAKAQPAPGTCDDLCMIPVDPPKDV